VRQSKHILWHDTFILFKNVFAGAPVVRWIVESLTENGLGDLLLPYPNPVDVVAYWRSLVPYLRPFLCCLEPGTGELPGDLDELCLRF